MKNILHRHVFIHFPFIAIDINDYQIQTHLFLADVLLHATLSDIGTIPSVSLSVCLSVTKCIVALMVGAGVLKLHRRVPWTAHPTQVFRHICYRMYHSATTQ